MRCVVLGATGHIGSHITRVLVSEGHEVRAAYRRSEYLSVLSGLSVEKVCVDLETLKGLREACEGCDWVFHAAAYYPHLSDQPDVAVKKGIDTAEAVAGVIAEAGPSRVVYTSSASTIRKCEGRASTDLDIEPWPLEGWRPLYATVKIAMEHAILQAQKKGLPVVVVNPTVCIGEYDAHTFSGNAVLLFAKWRIPFAIANIMNVVYTGDVGLGHVRAAEKGIIGQRYILAGERISLLDFGKRVAIIAGTRKPLGNVPYALAWPFALACEAGGELMRKKPFFSRQLLQYVKADSRELDGSRAVRELGMPQTPLDEAIRRAVTWFRENGYF